MKLDGIVSRQEVYGRLLQFIDSNQVYSVDRLYGLLSSTGMSRRGVGRLRIVDVLARFVRGTRDSARTARTT